MGVSEIITLPLTPSHQGRGNINSSPHMGEGKLSRVGSTGQVRSAGLLTYTTKKETTIH
jgi:hypothetical protein